MIQLLTGVLTAAAVVAGALVTALLGSRASRAEQEQARQEELRRSLAAYGVAVDRLDVRIGQLPAPPKKAGRLLLALLRRWSDLDWLIGRLSVTLLGRGTMRAVDELIHATNQLMLIAPDSLLPEIETISDLLGRVVARDEEWKAEWRAARESLAAASRAAVEPD